MRILLINFVMDRNSPVLAWQHSVALRLAAKCERVVVLTEGMGECALPANVEVHRVPRILTTPLRMLGAKWLMNIPVWSWCAREGFDAAFLHMNADWAYRLAPCWRQFGIPVLLWYAHGTVTNRLRRAHDHAARVVTSTPEGFRIPSSKVRVIGQGIDTDLFTLPVSRPDNATIVAVGRVSRRKSLDLMVETLAWLKTNAPQYPFRLRIIGPTLTRDDRAFAAELADTVKRRGDLASRVTFEGPRAMGELPAIYGSAFLHVNLSETGSMDKTILESLACGCPTLTSNASAFPLLEAFPELIVRTRTADAIGRQICRAYERRHANSSSQFRRLVVGRHDLNSYVEQVYDILAELAGQPDAPARLAAVCK
jgi:glycosyltransferase involved in cell wall biosynthesis